MKISIIAAMANKNVIGQDNKMPWHLPADLKHFKSLTLNKPIIMGRKTFESIGKALPQRRNIIITHQKDYQVTGCEVCHSIEEALKLCQDEQEVMIIGGANLYQQVLAQADKMYLTFIKADFEGDTFFPSWSANEWTLVEEHGHPADAHNPYYYSFTVYERL